jgi:hypothetical protein
MEILVLKVLCRCIYYLSAVAYSQIEESSKAEFLERLLAIFAFYGGA